MTNTVAPSTATAEISVDELHSEANQILDELLDSTSRTSAHDILVDQGQVVASGGGDARGATGARGAARVVWRVCARRCGVCVILSHKRVCIYIICTRVGHRLAPR